MRSGRVQASYVYDDGRRYFATHTYDNRTDAEGWLANERKLIELGEWSPPESRAAQKVLAGVTLREYAEQWVKHRDLTPKTHALYTRLLNSRILPELGAETLRAVTPAKVRAWWVGLGKETRLATRRRTSCSRPSTTPQWKTRPRRRTPVRSRRLASRPNRVTLSRSPRQS